MELLPFKDLPKYQPRRFTPDSLNLSDIAQILPVFDKLELAAAEADTAETFEQWIVDWGEVSAVLDEESSRRHIAMTCHTDSEEAEKAHLHYIEVVEPALKPRQFKLYQTYLAHPCLPLLPKARHQVFERNARVHVELYREENVPLETEEAKIGQQYQKLSGGLTVQFRGEEKTLTQVGRLLEEPDRALREEVWRMIGGRRLREAEAFEAQIDQLLEIRHQIARNAGFDNYRDYAFKARGRFDYSPSDCLDFHSAIEVEVMPLVRELQAARAAQMRLGSLRPWDLAVDPLGQAPLRPFADVAELGSKTQGIFDQLDPKLAEDFKILGDRGLLDLDNRKGKAPGGYQSTLAESRLPFIFMNAVGVQRDVETLLHEAGHAFHTMASRDEPIYGYRHAPIEFCEVASMSMELLGNEHIETFYPAAEARRARREHLEGIVKVFPWIATVDAFQHWLYTHPGHTVADRDAAWTALMARFGGGVDWAGLETFRAKMWHRQLHIFLYPFYYVEYGIAQMGALQVWANSRADRHLALGKYLKGLSLGGARPLPELFETAGCRFDFSAATLRPLVQLLRAELAKLA